MKLKTIALGTAVSMTVAAAAIAAAHENMPAQIVARHGLMTVISLNLGVVGDMARGRAEYDADAAKVAADNLAAVAGISQELLWPEGTSSDDREDSRALPKVWEDRAGFDAAWDDYGTAAAALAEVAADGSDALGGAMGALGKSCGNCHDTYRKPKD